MPWLLMLWEVYVSNWKNNFVNNEVGILFASVTQSMSLCLSVIFVEYLNVPRERQIYDFFVFVRIGSRHRSSFCLVLFYVYTSTSTSGAPFTDDLTNSSMMVVVCSPTTILTQLYVFTQAVIIYSPTTSIVPSIFEYKSLTNTRETPPCNNMILGKIFTFSVHYPHHFAPGSSFCANTVESG